MDPEELFQLVAQAQARAIDLIAKSGELAEQHARRAERRGDNRLASQERARAARAREIVFQAGRDGAGEGGSADGSWEGKRWNVVHAPDLDPRRRDGAARRPQARAPGA